MMCGMCLVQALEKCTMDAPCISALPIHMREVAAVLLRYGGDSASRVPVSGGSIGVLHALAVDAAGGCGAADSSVPVTPPRFLAAGECETIAAVDPAASTPVAFAPSSPAVVGDGDCELRPFGGDSVARPTIKFGLLSEVRCCAVVSYYSYFVVHVLRVGKFSNFHYSARLGCAIQDNGRC